MAILMAICPDCGATVSHRALACPRCGRVLRIDLFVGLAMVAAAFAVYIWRVADMLHAFWRR